MKSHAPVNPEGKRCFDGICETLDRLGVPRNSKWRALILFMRSIRDYDIYTPEQKRQIQALVVQVLKEGDLTETRFDDISRKTEAILSAPWRTKLQNALNDLSRAIGDSRGIILKRKGDIESLGQETVENVQSGKDLDALLEDIRKGFTDVVRYMEQDAENLARLSFTDALTGLANRRAFEDALAKAVAGARARKTPLCVLMVDVDHFKAFNDLHGHLIGDQALNAVASVIRDCQKQVEERGGKVLSARYGGEEFTVIAQDMALKQAVALAEHIRHRIETYNFIIRDVDGEILNSGITLTVSLGVACLDDAWKDSLEQRLINAADEAMYQAKLAGRNKVFSKGD
ncbi:GGDEF domain-containing protein [Fundidesulfovibrio magnetotacticus]|nr:GGDEF domain-containing protein [Fundidesulfovibrio magnetotacticus]